MSAKKAKEKDKEVEQEVQEAAVQEETTTEAAQASEADSLQKQIDGLNDQLMRTLAEYDNYRKRSQRERLEVYPEAVAATVTKFLPVLDNFERAIQSDCADAEYKKGVEMIFQSFREALKGLNVEEIEAEGKEFDPNLHNAVMHVENEELGENVVSQVLQKGYRIGDRVLRHAMVQVAN